jgi:hypothetical protein
MEEGEQYSNMKRKSSYYYDWWSCNHTVAIFVLIKIVCFSLGYWVTFTISNWHKTEEKKKQEMA